MYERLLKESERYFERQKEIVIPVKQVWDVMVKLGRSSEFTVPALLADFECLLDGDRRFQLMTTKGIRQSKNREDDDTLEQEEMGKLGFDEVQLVKLRRIPLPMQDEEESLDALDRSISLEDLDGDLADTALLDGGQAGESSTAARRLHPRPAGKKPKAKKAAKGKVNERSKPARKKPRPKKSKK